MIKTTALSLLIFLLMLPMVADADTSLNEAVKEARRSGQVLSAKTRDGMHEIRVMTPQGTIRTVRKQATTAKPNDNRPTLQNPIRFHPERPNNSQHQQQLRPQHQRPQSRPQHHRPKQRAQQRSRNNKSQQPRRQPQQRDPD